jgi:predicted ribosome quality control (RQC) complex YloA/Tae2 family protein
MEIEIDYTKSAYENAGHYYDRAKKLGQKQKGAEKSIINLKAQLEEAKEKSERKREVKVSVILKKEWYERFHWLKTSNGMMAVGGRDAHQNEMLNSKYFTEADLFFHADIFGASVFVLRDGASARKETRDEVAHFAACYSSAWKQGLRVIDVYSMRREQVTKSSQKGSLGTGSFLLKGEREWYRNCPLELILYLDKSGALIIVPRLTFEKLNPEGAYAVILQGRDKKSDAAKKISKILGYKDLDRIVRELPAGDFSISAGKVAPHSDTSI